MRGVKATVIQRGNAKDSPTERGHSPVEISFPFDEAPSLATVPGLYELDVEMGVTKTQRTYNGVTSTKDVASITGLSALCLGPVNIFDMQKMLPMHPGGAIK